MFDLSFFLNSILAIPLFMVSHIGFSMLKEYMQVSYCEAEKNKKEN